MKPAGAPIVLTLNSGSSSLKFGLYRMGAGDPEALIAGEIEAQGAGGCRIAARDAGGVSLIDEAMALADPADGVARLGALFARAGLPAPTAVGHRIVHGGARLRDHCLIDDAVVRALTEAVPFAPLHGPQALAVIAYAQRHFPGVPQVACFDTAFHATMPDVASTLPLPAEWRALGIRRYGFHGLSCVSILRQLGPAIPDRVVIAHLGNGASITAVRAGRSIDTSMGLTPSGGVIMGSRTGDLDPGILLYLLRTGGLDAAALEEGLDRHGGLLGLSGLSGDVRQLNAAQTPAANLALEMFRISVAKQIAGMIVALGGIDALVFTGGIGEHDAPTREGVVARLVCCGLSQVLVLPSREDEEIARITLIHSAGRLSD